jgi:glycosyltransferase involved in cell wall biosynthesis
MEAMATGLPTVATRIMGIPEIVEHGVTGLLVPPARADALADALEWLASRPAERREMGEAGRRKVLEERNPRRCGEQLLALVAKHAA